MSPLRPCLPLLAIATALVATPLSAANLYKWVDDKGVTHYTDKMPPDAVDKASVELNRQGIAVKRTEPAPTPEQRRAKALEEERLKATARERETVDRRDRALMQSYTTEDEIDLARTRALSTLDTQVTSAQAYSAQLAKRRDELEAKRKSYGSKPVPAAIDTELESIADELAKQATLIGERKRDSAAMTAKYDQDKQRWRELRNINEAAAAAEAAKAAGTRITGNAVQPAPGASAGAGAVSTGTRAR
jgi:hypothetical protein